MTPGSGEKGGYPMAMTQENAAWFAETFARMVGNVGLALLGKEEVVRLALVTMLAEGHLLLEDAPGTGKTALLGRWRRRCRGRTRGSSSRRICCLVISRG